MTSKDKISFSELMSMSNTKLLKMHKKQIINMLKEVKGAYNTAKFDTSDIDMVSVKLFESMDEHNKCKNTNSKLLKSVNELDSELSLLRKTLEISKKSEIKAIKELYDKRCFWERIKFW